RRAPQTPPITIKAINTARMTDDNRMGNPLESALCELTQNSRQRVTKMRRARRLGSATKPSRGHICELFAARPIISSAVVVAAIGIGNMFSKGCDLGAWLG